jgi:hypothetical protein
MCRRERTATDADAGHNCPAVRSDNAKHAQINEQKNNIDPQNACRLDSRYSASCRLSERS